MARPLRIEYAGAFYHVLNRGLERRVIFKDGTDHHQFLSRFLEVYRKYHLLFHAFCLMPNHYHLLVETPHGGLSQAMRHLDGFYTQDFNRRYTRVGPLFQGRYKAMLIEKESYALELSRYIHLNPVKAGLAQTPQEYPGSSYPFYHAPKPAPPYLDTHWLLSQFSSPQREARKKFHIFTLQGLGIDFEPQRLAKAGCLLGTEVFCENIQRQFLRGRDADGVPALRKIRQMAPLGDYQSLVEALTSNPLERKRLLLYALRYTTPMTLREIGKRVGDISHHVVSKTATRMRERRKTDRSWDRLVTQLEEKVSNI